MGKKSTEAEYRNWVEETLAKLPGEVRHNFEVLVEDGSAKEIFGGYQRETDYYRRLNDLKDEQREFEGQRSQWWNWYEQEAPKNQALLAERDALLERVNKLQSFVAGEAGVTPPPARPASAPDNNAAGIEKEVNELKTKLQAMDMALPRLLGDWGKVTKKIAVERWEIEPDEVLNLALTKGVDLNTAFNELTAGEKAKRDQDSLDKKLKEAEEKGRREALTRTAPPDQLRLSGPAFDIPKDSKTPSSNRDRVSEALSAFHELPEDMKKLGSRLD